MMARIIDLELYNLVGDNVRKYRIKMGLSQQDLSERLEAYAIYICRGSICRIESYERTVTDFELKAFSEILEVPIDKLFA
ncbi:MAG: helix-turn-helix domain-containing protein [Lachnospiraceae bacterium]|nr:helix-turn-helix domain-containing protein [Lachnospiraceae bacterium]